MIRKRVKKYIKEEVMKKRVMWMIFVFVPFVTRGGEVDRIAEKVQKMYESVRDMRAKFVQTVYYRNIDRKEMDTGTVLFKKPDKMKWSYTTPNTQIIVCDGKKIWFYVPADAQVMVGNVSEVFSSNVPTNFLSGMGKLKDEFKVKLEKKEGGEALLRLIPIKPLEGIKDVFIKVDVKTGLVLESIIVDNLNNETRIELKDIKINTGIPDSEFVFKIPPGIEVIESKPRMK